MPSGLTINRSPVSDICISPGGADGNGFGITGLSTGGVTSVGGVTGLSTGGGVTSVGGLTPVAVPGSIGCGCIVPSANPVCVSVTGALNASLKACAP